MFVPAGPSSPPNDCVGSTGGSAFPIGPATDGNASALTGRAEKQFLQTDVYVNDAGALPPRNLPPHRLLELRARTALTPVTARSPDRGLRVP
jgi:hypothetical protein